MLVSRQRRIALWKSALESMRDRDRGFMSQLRPIISAAVSWVGLSPSLSGSCGGSNAFPHLSIRSSSRAFRGPRWLGL